MSDEVAKMYGPEQDFHIQKQVKPLSPLYGDLLRVFQALHIVINNGPESVGGGGTPRRPPAAPRLPQVQPLRVGSFLPLPGGEERGEGAFLFALGCLQRH